MQAVRAPIRFWADDDACADKSLPGGPPLVSARSEGVRIDRRAFAAKAAGGAVSLWLVRETNGAEATGASHPKAGQSFPGLITREREPLNLEMPFPTLDSFITPTNQFFVRSHFAIPKLDAMSWRLKCEGHVNRALELSY